MNAGRKLLPYLCEKHIVERTEDVKVESVQKNDRQTHERTIQVQKRTTGVVSCVRDPISCSSLFNVRVSISRLLIAIMVVQSTAIGVNAESFQNRAYLLYM